MLADPELDPELAAQIMEEGNKIIKEGQRRFGVLPDHNTDIFSHPGFFPMLAPGQGTPQQELEQLRNMLLMKQAWEARGHAIRLFEEATGCKVNSAGTNGCPQAETPSDGQNLQVGGSSQEEEKAQEEKAQEEKAQEEKAQEENAQEEKAHEEKVQEEKF
ncbi:hypothetical protein BJ508DRAFT_418439 [Ascobolus immersus RN42]|uniref:Uncharacterized protein n=1 Tax=Ascobolus immersus RN42 TaxID=1160509 RepID=A0A3N4HM11_ASCIM|nr:hypothetical protein BJ508DRAFT_418439 [Ascobolus immersus RN42]